jgi:calcineurin-like phosphoesterase family protein
VLHPNLGRHRPAICLITLAIAAGCLATATSGPAAPVAVIRSQAQAPAAAAPPTPLPNKDGSLKFAVLGDFGTGDKEQYLLGEQMAKVREQFPFEFVVTVGDNIYGGESARDFQRKFELPYKLLLDAKVKFYASLGNHDSRQQVRYAPFNMDGQTYYTFKAPHEDVRFFALESDYLNPTQLAWLEKELESSTEDWKIPYFHHPLYSSADRHGSDTSRRKVLEPLFIKYGVSVVLAGHDHVYERTKPQNGIVHFVVGSGGQLRRGNLEDRSPIMAAGNDTIQVFMAAEISDDEMTFNAISRTGEVVDSGVIVRRKPD